MVKISGTNNDSNVRSVTVISNFRSPQTKLDCPPMLEANLSLLLGDNRIITRSPAVARIADRTGCK